MMKHFCYTFTILILFTTLKLEASSQNEWTSYLENDTIKIEYKYQNCNYTEQFNSEYLILKITNNTNNQIIVTWEELLWIDNSCINCETVNKENRKKTTITANSFNIGK